MFLFGSDFATFQSLSACALEACNAFTDGGFFENEPFDDGLHCCFSPTGPLDNKDDNAPARNSGNIFGNNNRFSVERSLQELEADAGRHKQGGRAIEHGPNGEDDTDN